MRHTAEAAYLATMHGTTTGIKQLAVGLGHRARPDGRRGGTHGRGGTQPRRHTAVFAAHTAEASRSIVDVDVLPSLVAPPIQFCFLHNCAMLNNPATVRQSSFTPVTFTNVAPDQQARVVGVRYQHDNGIWGPGAVVHRPQ